VLLREPADQLLDGLGLAAGAGVAEQLGPVDGDDDAVVELALEVVLEHLGGEQLAEPMREPPFAEDDA